MDTSYDNSPALPSIGDRKADAASGADGFVSGAVPSSTAPSNYINPQSPGFRYLGHGLDSLYLSYRGRLLETAVIKLQGLKELAQSTAPRDAALAQIDVGTHLFQVSSQGSGMFRFILENDHYKIYLSAGQSGNVPVAYIQVRSKITHSLNPFDIDAQLRSVLTCFAVLSGQASCSRLDLHLDFQSEVDMAGFSIEAWVTRADDAASRYHKGVVNGWTVGEGGEIFMRLYDKTLETKKKQNFHSHDLWRAHGWDGSEKVWRVEFQLRNEPLKQLGVLTIEDLNGACGPVWLYCCNEWLQLKCVHPTDTNRTRWSIHPLWVDIQNVPGWNNRPIAQRLPSSHNFPCDERLFVHGLGGISSFMAIHNIRDPEKGFSAFYLAARTYFAKANNGWPHALGEYLAQKVDLKRRRFHMPVAQTPEGGRGPEGHGK